MCEKKIFFLGATSDCASLSPGFNIRIYAGLPFVYMEVVKLAKIVLVLTLIKGKFICLNMNVCYSLTNLRNGSLYYMFSKQQP